MCLESNRLLIRRANITDTPLLISLWTNPRVMANVGFPNGLNMSEEEIQTQIMSEQKTESLLDCLLVIETRMAGNQIGQCITHEPNEKGIASTDIKLLPGYWGNRYGVETKQTLLDYLFTQTNCTAVEATPNVNNLASIKMQESVGGVRVGQAVYEFPESMTGYTASVHHYIYRVSRISWVRTGSDLSSEARQ